MPQISTLRIATRKSPLALWQSEHVISLINAVAPEIECVLVPMSTSGDKFLKDSLAVLGGKGNFVKELERALLDDQADIAVHSMKDVPVNLPDNLIIGAYLEREDPRDCFISNNYQQLQQLPQGAKLGTASLRRKALVKYYRPDLQVEMLRGNVNTRLAKLEQGEYDAIILAAAGLKRLAFTNKISSYFDIDQFVPAITQGVMGVECLQHNTAVRDLLNKINHPLTAKIAETERAFNRRLGGACHVPVAGYANLQNEQLHMTGLVAETDGSRIIRQSLSANINDYEQLGTKLADALLEQGADTILKAFR